MIKLRPHHLLCIQGFVGKGYSDEFVQNMKLVIDKLKFENCKVEIVFDTDDICIKCPNMLGENLCSSNDKVNSIDKKVIHYFNIEEKEYVYDELVEYIKSNMSLSMMKDICLACEWFDNSPCKDNIVNYNEK